MLKLPTEFCDHYLCDPHSDKDTYEFDPTTMVAQLEQAVRGKPNYEFGTFINHQMIDLDSRVESIATIGRSALETHQTEFGEIINQAVNLNKLIEGLLLFVLSVDWAGAANVSFPPPFIRTPMLTHSAAMSCMRPSSPDACAAAFGSALLAKSQP